MSQLMRKYFIISTMEYVKFHNILIVFIIIIKLYKNIFVVSHFVGNIIPQNYKLLFNFEKSGDCSSEKCMYYGEVTITMVVSGRANSFILQSDPETTIDKSKTQMYRIYQNETKMPLKIIDYIHTNGDTSSIIEIKIEQIFHMISETQYELMLYFTRRFNDHRGFYNVSTSTNSESILMIAHLIPNRVHRFFPCLNDQHKWISSFEVTIIYPSTYKVVTGMILKQNIEISPHTYMSIYEKTKKMPTEHLFFIIWRYTLRPVGILKFWLPPNVDDNDFTPMAIYTINCLKQMVNITEIMSPIHPTINIAPVSSSRIIDYYAVPGITLYKRERVLYHNDESSTTDKFELMTIICRAAVSQWIGVLIYPQSHSDYCLYRALAHYVADFILNSIEPKFRNNDMSLARTILWTRSERDLDASITIPFYLFDTWDDKMYFRREDYNVYQAMSIIAMIHEIYNFKDIGSLIIQALARWGRRDFGPTQKEIIDVLEKDNINALINDWSKLPGIPIIHLTLDRTEERVELIQERFNPTGPWSDNKFAWTIPIRCFNFDNKNYYFRWLIPNTTLVANAGEIKTCFLYADTVVPYRVNYPEKWWLEIISTLVKNPKNFGEKQKMRIIDDLLEFSLAGYIHIQILFELLTYLSNELDYLPWLAGAKAFIKLRGILSTSQTEEYKIFYKGLVIYAVHNVYVYLDKYNDDKSPDHNLRLHKKNIFNIACSFGHKKCLYNAQNRLNCYINEVSSDHCKNGSCYNHWSKCVRNADEREIILCQGLRRAPVETWIKVLKLLNNPHLFPSVRLAMARGLACTEDVDILENYLYYILENSQIFPSDHVFPILLTAARVSELNAQIILHFIIKNHEKLVERIELPYEYQQNIYGLSEDIYYTRSNNREINSQGSPLTYSELPVGVRNILQVNTIRANRLRPMIEDYLNRYRKRMHSL